MPQARIRRVTIEGHTSITRAEVDLGPVNLLIGANGSGKTNFVRSLELLGRIADQDLGLYVELAGGASMLVRQPKGRGIEIEVDGEDCEYHASLMATSDDRLIFRRERFSAKGDIAETDDFEERRESRLGVTWENEPEIISGGRRVFEMLKGCRVFHFHDTSRTAPVKQPGPTADNLALAADAGNLAAVLHAMRNSDGSTYRRIVGAVARVAPFFRDFVLREEAADRIRLRWRQTDSDTVFSTHQMSDGTLRFICLATLLLQPNLPGLVVLDEPELGLHPYAIAQLAGMLRAAAVKSQVVVATQSVTLIDQFAITDLIVVERAGDQSVFRRPEPEALRDWLDEYSLGEIWQKNLIGGRPKRDSI